MDKNKLHIISNLENVSKSILVCFLFFNCTLTTKGQDSIVHYRHNFGVFPVYEGIVFKYEHKLNSKRNKSFRYALTLKSHDDFSSLFPMKSYNEQKLAFQFRNYIKKGSSFKGFYHGTCLQFKHFSGEQLDFGFRGVSSRSVNIKSLGVGYTMGVQRMTKSGFNYEIGWALYYQHSNNERFWNSDIWSWILFADIPYNPYGIFQSQLTFGIGMAIK